MTDIELAMCQYDGDNTKPYCDLIYSALKEKRDRTWISVKKRLPEEGLWVLALRSNKAYHLATWQHNHWNRRAGLISNITHWMPLPKPPEGEI